MNGSEASESGAYAQRRHTPMSTDALNYEGHMPALDLFRPDGSFLHLQEDWRRGLGWWLVDRDQRRHISVLEAIRLAPKGVAHEVFLELQYLVWQLESEEVGQDSGASLHDALSRLRREVILAGTSESTSLTAAMRAALGRHAELDRLVQKQLPRQFDPA